MKPIWKDNELRVELHKPEIAVLKKAREIGQALQAMHQSQGETMVTAINAILAPEVDDE